MDPNVIGIINHIDTCSSTAVVLVDLFGSECSGHQFKITFQSGQKIHWLYGCILDKQQYFHPRKFDRDYTSTKL